VKRLLDTNAYVAWKRGDARVAGLIRSSEKVFLSTVVAGELLFGFRSGTRYASNRADLDLFLASPYVSLLPVTLDTADTFGRICAALKRKGHPIPTNDVWIAAHAMEVGAELVSFDRHFEAVDGLSWTDPSPDG
jgi:tRNA(fMet)-specific endonuclease VapC